MGRMLYFLPLPLLIIMHRSEFLMIAERMQMDLVLAVLAFYRTVDID